MSRIYEVFAKQKRRQLEVLPTEDELGPKHSSEESYFELPRLLMDLSPELLEEFKCITKNLTILGSTKLKTIMLCGVEFDNDPFTVALNLAVFMGRTEEESILLVESDRHSPLLHRFHRGKKCDGFCELLEEHRPIELYAMPTTEPGLFLIRAGGLMDPEKKKFPRVALEHVVTELKSCFSFVIFTAPPVGTEDCLNLAGCVDGVVLVIKSGELAERVAQAKLLLDKAQARILGVIMTR